MKNKKILYLYIISVICLVGCFSDGKKVDFKNDKSVWAAYFAQTDTEIAYSKGKDEANIVIFNDKKNIDIYSDKSYPTSSMLYYNNKLLYQNILGVKELGKSEDQKNILSNKKTIGYNMTGLIKDYNYYYFLANESFRNNIYISNLIIGDDNDQRNSEVEGFIETYVEDGTDLYLLTDDNIKTSLTLQKVHINEDKSVKIEKNSTNFDGIYSSFIKMLVKGNKIYCFAQKEREGLYLLVYSKDTLKLEKNIQIYKFKNSNENGKYSASFSGDLLQEGDNVIIPTTGGSVYKVNIKTYEFNEIFKLKNFDIDINGTLTTHCSGLTNTISFIFFDVDSKKYKVMDYDVNGKIKEELILDNFKPKNKTFPHNLIKVK